MSYLIIGEKTLNLNNDEIMSLFGCNGVVANSFEKNIFKYAFYNTGKLCQVSHTCAGRLLKVECFDNTSRREDVLYWLKQYLITGMEMRGFGTIIHNSDGFFIASFYTINGLNENPPDVF